MIVVVPSAAFLQPDLAAETGCRSHALIPLGGRPLYEHIRDSYRALDPRAWIVLAVHADIADLLTDSDPQTLVVGIRNSRSISETVLAAIQGAADRNLLADDIPLIVHMADTLVGPSPDGRTDQVYIEERDDIYRWTSLVAQDGRIRIVRDRDASSADSEQQSVLVGVFAFNSSKTFRSKLQQSLQVVEPGIEPFFRALEEYSRERRMDTVRPEFWYDFGHVDSYYESKLLYQNVRHFNHLAYDPAQGIVTKTSQSTELFRHQVRWYRQVPDELRAFLPRIFSSSDGESPSIIMEMLPFPTLSELFVFQRLPLGAWNSVAKAIAAILGRFDRYSFSTQTAAAMAESMYLVKTRQRIEQFLNQDNSHGRLVAAGGSRTLPQVLTQLERFVEQHGLLELDALSPIHGDMCFSNIFFDNRLRLIKMIDPRGEFGVPGIYGDPLYDLAKLFHSVSGGYDFVVSDQFRVKAADDGAIELQLASSTYHQKVAEVFHSVLLRDAERSKRVAAVETLLFLSMLPLHKDRPDRQKALLAIGLRKFDSLAPSL